jgi:tetratricopeptide (TPR) repeat protein
VSKSPDNSRAHFQLAFAYFAGQRCSEAVDQFAKVAELQEPDYRLLVDWGLAYDCAARPAEALAKLREAAGLERTAHVYALIGMMQAKQGWNDAALESLDTAEKINPRFAITYFYRGNIFVSTGKDREAVAEYDKAVELDANLDAASRAAQSARQRLAGQAR